MKNLKLFILPIFVGLLFSGCTDDTQIEASQKSADAETFSKIKKQAAIYGDCYEFATVETKTSFKPTSGKFDEVYLSAGFKKGIGLISESKPGDKDYNGGRWHVNVIHRDVDPNKYLNACSVEDLDLADFESTDVYFECPMIPLRSNTLD